MWFNLPRIGVSVRDGVRIISHASSRSSKRAQSPTTYAVIDLGSNSFHMLIANRQGQSMHILDRLREHVCLADGFDEYNNLTAVAMQRGLDCLARFAQRIRELPDRCVRVVGTNTLRRAHNAAEFLRQGREVLGYPIEVIAGREEARLIYLGVAHTHSPYSGKRLVVDIGGGSTELIVGQGFKALERESLHMGCVGMTLSHFADGKLTKAKLRQAELKALMELTPVLASFKRVGWDVVVGASGTIKAVASICQELGWSDSGITPEVMQQLETMLLDAGHVDKLSLPGLSAERRQVMPGGYAVLKAIFTGLQLQQLQVANGALREGVLYDLFGRRHHVDDVRVVTISDLKTRYAVDLEQAARVANTATELFNAVAKSWQLDTDADAELLQWAAEVHEIGLLVAHAQYHRHAEYILTQADLPGFSRQEQRTLALLVRAHRRKFPADVFAGLAEPLKQSLSRLVVLLRLAVVLHRSREQTPLPALDLQASGQKLKLSFPKDWLAEHPLTEALLAEESELIKAAGIKLSVA